MLTQSHFIAWTTFFDLKFQKFKHMRLGCRERCATVVSFHYEEGVSAALKFERDNTFLCEITEMLSRLGCTSDYPIQLRVSQHTSSIPLIY